MSSRVAERYAEAGEYSEAFDRDGNGDWRSVFAHVVGQDGLRLYDWAGVSVPRLTAHPIAPGRAHRTPPPPKAEPREGDEEDLFAVSESLLSVPALRLVAAQEAGRRVLATDAELDIDASLAENDPETAANPKYQRHEIGSLLGRTALPGLTVAGNTLG